MDKVDEEFYSLMESKKREIDSLDISREEREGLYSLLKNNIDYHEKEKEFTCQEEINQAYDSFGKSLKDFIDVANNLTKNNNSLHIIHVNQQIQIAKQNAIKKQIEERLTEERKLEIKLTTQLICMQMKQTNRNQNP